jgi:hypothetical protein
MTASTLLETLAARGVMVRADGDTLRIKPVRLVRDLDAAIREHKPALLNLLSAQSTLEAAGAPPRDDATWDADQCLWLWRHWIIRTCASIELEKSMLGGTSAPPVKLPALRPHPATPEDIAFAESIMRIANTFLRAKRLKYNRWSIEGERYSHDATLRLAAHRTGQTSNGMPLSVDTGAAYRESQSTLTKGANQ